MVRNYIVLRKTSNKNYFKSILSRVKEIPANDKCLKIQESPLSFKIKSSRALVLEKFNESINNNEIYKTVRATRTLNRNLTSIYSNRNNSTQSNYSKYDFNISPRKNDVKAPNLLKNISSLIEQSSSQARICMEAE